MVPKNCAILTGTTASGKSEIAFSFAKERGDVELISADSLAVYRGTNIASAKPSARERAEIPHHLIDVFEPSEDFSAGKFARLAREAIADISRRGKKALIVGGTGFYLKALLRGVWEDTEEADPGLRAELETLDSPALHARLEVLDADSAKRIGPTDRYRLVRALEIIHQSGTTPSDHRRQHAGQEPLEIPLLVTDRPKDELEARMGERVDRMLQAGLLAEAQHIRERFPSSRVLNSVGYRQIFETPAPGAPAELRERIRVATRQLAKAQRTWFRGQHPEAEWFLLENDRAKLWARLHEIL